MVADQFGYLTGQPRRSGREAAALVPAVVSRVDSTGVWVTPIGADTAHPVGPVQGGLRPALIPGGLGVYTLGWEPWPLGTKCLVVNTTEGPFLVAP